MVWCCSAENDNELNADAKAMKVVFVHCHPPIRIIGRFSMRDKFCIPESYKNESK